MRDPDTETTLNKNASGNYVALPRSLLMAATVPEKRARALRAPATLGLARVFLRRACVRDRIQATAGTQRAPRRASGCGRRMKLLRRLFERRAPELIPELITVLVTRGKNGDYDVQFISEPEIPNDPAPTGTLSEIRATVDELILERYLRDERFAGLLSTRHLGIGYAMYPWDDRGRKVPKELARQMGTDFVMFDVEETDDGFVASAVDVIATAHDLDALANQARQALSLRWSDLADPIPGMLNWQRTLTASGFQPFRRSGGTDATSRK